MQNQNPHHLPFVASLLTVLMGIGMLAQSFVGITSAQLATGITVVEPASGSTWFWGETYTVRYTTDASVGGVSIFLSKGGAASGLDGGWGGVMLNSGCATDPLLSVQSCTVSVPSKPADVEDGDGYFLILDEVGALGQPKRGLVGISMASSEFGEFGVSLGLATESTTVGLGSDSLTAMVNVNNSTVLPAGEKIRRAQVSVLYDETKVAAPATVTAHPAFSASIRNDLSDPLTGVIVFEVALANEALYPTSAGFQLISWGWVPLSLGLTHTEIDWTGAKVAGDGSDVWLSANAGSDTYGDMLIDLNDQSADFQVALSADPSMSGTYYSLKQNLTTSTQRLVSLGKFTPVYNDNLSTNGIVSDTKFALGFFDANGKNLCNTVALPNDPANPACGTPGEFDPNGSGYFMINIDTSGTDYELAALSGRPWSPQVVSVQARVYMSTSDYNDTTNPSQPWVQSMSLSFTAETLGMVGGVFGQGASVARGSSVSYSFVIDPYDTADFTGSATWSVTPVQGGNTEVTFSPATEAINFDGSDAAVTINTTITATQNAAVDTPYLFNIEVRPADTSKAFWPTEVAVTVTSSNAAQFSISLTPAAANVAPGGTTQYTVSGSALSGFTGNIQLTDNLATVFGDDISNITYQPASRIIAGNGTVVITVTTATANTSSTPRSFTVTGTSGSSTATATGQLTITSASNLKNISLVITAPIEGGHDSAQPMFTFRLYDGANLKTFEKADIKTTADKATLAISNLVVGTTYKGYLRSTRHLWRQADATITVAATEDNYAMSFFKLLAGDVHANNLINALDMPVFTRDWGKQGAGLIPDINGDGAVNVNDIQSMFVNYFKSGATVPTE